MFVVKLLLYTLITLMLVLYIFQSCNTIVFLSPLLRHVSEFYIQHCQYCFLPLLPLLRNQGPQHMPGMHRSLKAYCATLLTPLCFRHSHFHCQMSPRPTRWERSKQQKVELVGENVNQKFCLNVALHATFRDLLHAVNLRHGTDGFTSPPNEGVLRMFFALKNPDGLGT